MPRGKSAPSVAESAAHADGLATEKPDGCALDEFDELQYVDSRGLSLP